VSTGNNNTQQQTFSSPSRYFHEFADEDGSEHLALLNKLNTHIKEMIMTFTKNGALKNLPEDI
jgi:hypothetical protein